MRQNNEKITYAKHNDISIQSCLHCATIAWPIVNLEMYVDSFCALDSFSFVFFCLMSMSNITEDKFSRVVYEDKVERIFFWI